MFWYPRPSLFMIVSSSRGEYLSELPEREKEFEKSRGEVVDSEREDSWVTRFGEEGFGDKRCDSSSRMGGKGFREGLRLLVIAERERSIFRCSFNMVGHSHDLQSSMGSRQSLGLSSTTKETFRQNPL